MAFNDGLIIWITGFSGSGKTTTAKILQEKLRSIKNIHAIILDGDEMRASLGVTEKHHSSEERKNLAYIYAKFAKLLALQGFYVIVATISMFEEVRLFNRMNNKHYFEIYLKVSEATRKKRDHKKLYALNQEMVEINQFFEEPKNPDLVLDDSLKLSPEEIAEHIQNKIFNLKGKNL